MKHTNKFSISCLIKAVLDNRNKLIQQMLLLVFCSYSVFGQISRTQIINNALPYTTYTWNATSANKWNSVSCGSKTVQYASSWVVTGSNTSMPYCWGGWSTTTQHNTAMTGGKSAGDVNTATSYGAGLSCASGHDCSGLVSRAWALSSKQGTYGLSGLSTQINYSQLQSGDIVNKEGSHTRLIRTYYSSNNSADVIEASGTDWKTSTRTYTPIQVTGYLAMCPDATVVIGGCGGVAKFNIGDCVQPNTTVNVRTISGGVANTTSLGTHSSSDIGTVTAGPTNATLSGTPYVWYQVQWSTNPTSGWSVETYLDKVTCSTSYGFTLTVYNVNSQTRSNAKVILYNSSWVPQSTLYTNSSGQVVFPGLSNATYNYEVYYTPSISNVPSTPNEEFWGNSSVTISGSSVSQSFTRNQSYIYSAPSFSPSTLNTGQTSSGSFTVKNPLSYSKNSYVEVWVDRDKISSWDYNNSATAQSVSAGGTANFSFNVTPTNSGTYYYYAFVYSYVNSKYTLTDQYAWTSAFTASCTPPTPTITSSPGPYCQNGNSVSLTANPSGGTFSGSGVSGSTFNPANANIGSNTITYSVTQNGCTGSTTQNITVNPVPGTATVSGNSSGCAGAPITFSASASNATSYNWTAPAGWSPTSGSGTSFTSTPGSSGNVTATPSNSCGNGSSGSLYVTVNPASGAATVSGPASLTQNSNVNYSASASNATSYNWAVPTGWTINSGQGTSTINVTAGANSGQVCATPSNSCGNGTQGCQSVTVIPVGITNYTEDYLISIFPNPTPGNFTLAINGAMNKQANIQITNALGQKVYEWEGKISSAHFSQEIKLTGKAQSIFFADMIIDNKKQTRRIVKIE